VWLLVAEKQQFGNLLQVSTAYKNQLPVNILHIGWLISIWALYLLVIDIII